MCTLTGNGFRQNFGLKLRLWQEIWDLRRTSCVEFRRLSKNIKRSFWRLGMGIIATGADERVANVELTDDTLNVSLMDGRTIIVPLAWYPHLLKATPAQRGKWEIAGGGYGIHWPEIDEDLSTEGLLRGAPAPGAVPKK
jgi:hypothetical protein